jgi:hypothetical protein
MNKPKLNYEIAEIKNSGLHSKKPILLQIWSSEYSFMTNNAGYYYVRGFEEYGSSDMLCYKETSMYFEEYFATKQEAKERLEAIIKETEVIWVKENKRSSVVLEKGEVK